MFGLQTTAVLLIIAISKTESKSNLIAPSPVLPVTNYVQFSPSAGIVQPGPGLRTLLPGPSPLLRSAFPAPYANPALFPAAATTTYAALPNLAPPLHPAQATAYASRNFGSPLVPTPSAVTTLASPFIPADFLARSALLPTPFGYAVQRSVQPFTTAVAPGFAPIEQVIL